MLNLDAYCVRCGSAQHTGPSSSGLVRDHNEPYAFCSLCWKRRRPIPRNLRDQIDGLTLTLDTIRQQTAATWVEEMAANALAGRYPEC
jgi:hypothetical protein